MKRIVSGLSCSILLLILPACQTQPTPDQAQAFVERAEKQLLDLSTEAGRAQWVQSTYITDDTEALAAVANEKLIAAAAALAKEAAKYDIPNLPPDVARKIKLLKTGLTLAAPADPAESKELSQIAARMEGMYGKGEYCPGGTTDQSKCLDVNQITDIMANSRDPKQLRDAWIGWRTISPPMRKDYTRSWSCPTRGRANWASPTPAPCGARSTTCRPTRSPRNWTGCGSRCARSTVPLHAYVRWKLREKYGDPGGAGERADPRASAGQHVGADVGQHLSAGRAARTPIRATT